MSLLGFSRFDVVNICFELEYTFDKVHNLVNTPLEGCRYEFVHEESSSLYFSYAFPNLLGVSSVSSTCSQLLFPPSIL